MLRISDQCLRDRLQVSDATDVSGDAFRRYRCPTLLINIPLLVTPYVSTTTLMPDPTLPAGAAIAGFVMVVVSWYGMLRTGVHFTNNDIKDLKVTKGRWRHDWRAGQAK